MLGKCRRIKDNQIIGLIDISQKLKTIGNNPPMTVIAGKIEGRIDPGKLNSSFRSIDRINTSRSATKCINRKSSRIAKHVQHVPVLTIVLK